MAGPACHGWDDRRIVLERITRVVDTRHTVAVAAVVTLLLRVPGMTRPIRPDEAGFLLVARSWDPTPDSLYGRYFVDRPPLLIAFFRLGDALGGITAIRILGALACVVTVVLAAEVGRYLAGPGVGRWVAIVTAALTTNPLIDPVAVKGEILALPWLVLGIVGALRALERDSWRWAVLAGLASATATGFKQNLTGGLVFGGVLLLAAWATHQLHRWDVARLGAAALAGAAVPVVATLAWARLEGVRLSTLSYAVLGFRTDATEALSRGDATAPLQRAVLLAGVAVGAGLLLIVIGFLVHIRGEWRDQPAVTMATAALLLVDVAFLLASGSFWTDYLFALVPFCALAVALLSRRTTRRGTRMRLVVVLSAVSALVSLVVWIGLEKTDVITYPAAADGAAIGAAARPGDTLTVFGGRADLQFTSGLASPYSQLWSLPMRTLDPDYAQLRALLAGSRAPTWFVPWVSWGAWGNPAGRALETTVDLRYVRHGTGCEGRPIYLLRDVTRPPLRPRC